MAHKMSAAEKAEWDELYQYVKKNVLGYDDSQSLSRNMVLRLKGLLTNKFMDNNKIESTANYSYKLVLLTFKFCNPDIQRGLRSIGFKDENHKFNYILKIVESNLNTVYLRLKNAEKAKETTQTLDTATATHTGAEYQTKTEKTSKRLEEYW